MFLDVWSSETGECMQSVISLAWWQVTAVSQKSVSQGQSADLWLLEAKLFLLLELEWKACTEKLGELI